MVNIVYNFVVKVFVEKVDIVHLNMIHLNVVFVKGKFSRKNKQKNKVIFSYFHHQKSIES